jgi:hypothetical protein
MNVGRIASLAAVFAACVSLITCGKSAPTISRNPVDPANDPLYKTIHAMPDDTAKLHRLSTYVRDYIADRSCTGVDQCRTMGFGDKVCGGPREYLIFSKATVDSAVLRTLVREHFVVDSICNVKYRLGSDCAIELRPLVDCVDGECARVWK